MMRVNWQEAEVGKDEDGYFVKIPMGDEAGQPMKIYLEEIWEEYLGQKVTFDVGPVPVEGQNLSPEAKAVMEQLDLRESYPKIADNLNTFNFIAGKYRGSASGDLAYRVVRPETTEDFAAWQEQVQSKISEL